MQLLLSGNKLPPAVGISGRDWSSNNSVLLVPPELLLFGGNGRTVSLLISQLVQDLAVSSRFLEIPPRLRAEM